MHTFCGTVSLSQTEKTATIYNNMKNISSESVYLSYSGGEFTRYTDAENNIISVYEGNFLIPPVNHEKTKKAIIPLLIHSKEHLTEFIKGNYALLVCDVTKKEIYLYCDELCSIPVYYHFKNGIFSFSTNIETLTKITKVKRSLSFTSINKLISLMPALPPGETLYDDIYTVIPGTSITVTASGVSVKKQRFYLSFAQPFVSSYRTQRKASLYQIADINLSPSYTENPYILNCAKKIKKFTDKMLLDMYANTSFLMTYEKPYCFPHKKLLYNLLNKDVLNILIHDYASNYIMDEISNMENFNYKDEKDIEIEEIIYLNRTFLIPQITRNLFTYLYFHGIENASVLNSSEVFNNLISLYIKGNSKNTLNEYFNIDSSNLSVHTPDYRNKIKILCMNPKSDIFKIFDRFKLFENAANLPSSLAYYILQINYIMEKKGVTLEF